MKTILYLNYLKNLSLEDYENYLLGNRDLTKVSRLISGRDINTALITKEDNVTLLYCISCYDEEPIYKNHLFTTANKYNFNTGTFSSPGYLELIKMANYIYIVSDTNNDSIDSIIKAATDLNKTIVKYKVQKCLKKHKQ